MGARGPLQISQGESGNSSVNGSRFLQWGFSTDTRLTD